LLERASFICQSSSQREKRTSFPKGGRKVNSVQKCVHMHVNAKMIPVETVPWIGGEGIKGSIGKGEFKYVLVHTL
jgi:hypothetical protein